MSVKPRVEFPLSASTDSRRSSVCRANVPQRMPVKTRGIIGCVLFVIRLVLITKGLSNSQIRSQAVCEYRNSANREERFRTPCRCQYDRVSRCLVKRFLGASNVSAFSTTSDDFVYEYIGEVIPENIFRERIKDYADEGIQHFYFMMLQKGEVSPSDPNDAPFQLMRL
jgi:hypothetical protein